MLSLTSSSSAFGVIPAVEPYLALITSLWIWQRTEMMSRPSEQRCADAEARLRQDQDRLDEQIRLTESQLAYRFPRFVELSIPKPLALSQARTLMNSGEVLVSLTVGVNDSFLWAVRSDRLELYALDIRAGIWMLRWMRSDHAWIQQGISGWSLSMLTEPFLSIRVRLARLQL
jgi:hypothetical protein